MGLPERTKYCRVAIETMFVGMCVNNALDKYKYSNSVRLENALLPMLVIGLLLRSRCIRWLLELVNFNADIEVMALSVTRREPRYEGKVM